MVISEASLTSFSEQTLVALNYNPSVQKSAVIRTIKVASTLLFCPACRFCDVLWPTGKLRTSLRCVGRI